MTKAKTALDKAIGSAGISDVKTGRTSGVKRPAKKERDFIEMERDAQAAREGRATAQSRRGRIIEDENEKIAQDSRVVHFDVPAGTVDLNQLADMLARRLAPGQLIVGTGLGGGGGGIDGTGFGGAASNIPAIRGQITESGRNYDGQKTQGAVLATAPGPLESEVEALSNKLTVLHSLITELDSSLEPLLAHESDSADGNEPLATRSSESPHHRRLIDLGEGLDRAITRLRYTQSRVRT